MTAQAAVIGGWRAGGEGEAREGWPQGGFSHQEGERRGRVGRGGMSHVGCEQCILKQQCTVSGSNGHN